MTHETKKMQNKSKIFLSIIVIISIVIFLLASISVILFKNSGWVYSETGVLEILQGILLLFTFIYYLIAFLKYPQAKDSMITLFFAVLMWAFFLREVDFDKMNLPEILTFILYGNGRNITLIAGFSIAVIGAIIHFNRYIQQTRSFIFSIRGLLVVLACIFLWLGYIFERHLDIGCSELFEEGSELIAYLCLLSSALITKDKVSSLR